MKITSKILSIFMLVATFATVPAMAQDLGPTLSKIKKAGVITIGNRRASVPFSFVGNDGKPKGYTIDVCMHVVDSIEDMLGADLKVKYIPVTPQTRIPLIVNDQIDMECGSTTNTLTRQEQVDYSYPLFVTGTKILTTADSGIHSIEDLSGKVIALAPGTTNAQAIREAIKKRGIKNVQITNVTDHAEGFLALRTGRVDAYSTDAVLLYGLIAEADHPENFAVVGKFLSYDPYAIMMGQNDSQFRLVVNRTLANLFRSGEINDIYHKWFDPMGIPLTDALESVFQHHAYPK